MKIVELTIENIEELGFDAVALVEHPAMEANFYSFTQDNIEEVLLYNMLEDVVLKDIPEELVRYQEMSTQRETLESYNDYPQGASDNACKVLRWIDEHGRDEVAGMTQVGLRRANQLCNRENISEETIARMAAFERHRNNSEISEEYKGTPWKDKGYVAWLGWGGDAGIAWAQRKLKSIRKEEQSQEFKFSVEEEQQMVVGPLMIPNKMIYRVDPSTGEEYFVYFYSRYCPIRIARKMMREKKLDQVNLEHVQEAVVDGHMVETWLVDDPELDKQKVYNMNYPTGTWMGMYKVEDPKAWQMVKDQEIRRFFYRRFLQKPECSIGKIYLFRIRIK